MKIKKMRWEDFYRIAVPEEIRAREAQKNPFVVWSRWVSSREAYFLFHWGITGNMVSLFRVLLSIISLFLFSRLIEGETFLALLGVLLMTWQLNLDGVDGALARVQGVDSDFGNCLDNLGIDYARATFWVVIAAMTGNLFLIVVSALAGHLLVPFKQYLGIETEPRVDHFVRYFIYVPVLLVIVPLIMIFLSYLGVPSQLTCWLVSLFYISLAGIWFVLCLFRNLSSQRVN